MIDVPAGYLKTGIKEQGSEKVISAICQQVQKSCKKRPFMALREKKKELIYARKSSPSWGGTGIGYVFGGILYSIAVSLLYYGVFVLIFSFGNQTMVLLGVTLIIAGLLFLALATFTMMQMI
ncbi:MAG TPA: hypothetical protein VNY73_01695 [Bacteroidia bacterium]|jgi:hypothetical protein|nr:hypothetical protein [Bacteroidia bacterium]